jgi:hypothetical protein
MLIAFHQPFSSHNSCMSGILVVSISDLQNSKITRKVNRVLSFEFEFFEIVFEFRVF